ncbi:lymphotoxin-beta isoform X1 [Loxodonta africana]|uniref:Lymphotoxin-beta n=1 Tax=Loxodonta africana TaxID=9785 RepID=A0A0U5J5Z6_LOXAF|nr:lymphotoxin-beta isoform X1 [Loxodonta africana]CTQ86278.1 TPA: tumor necrosis factor ligand 1C [Loxodonta africana]
MEASGPEGRVGRPQGRGCLLLAVVGAIVLGSVVLSVPITVLTVLVLVPQDQGGVVTETADPGRQSQQQLEFQKLPEEKAETDLSPRLPAAHLIGSWKSGQGLGWETKKEEAFLRSGTQFSGAEGLALPQDGLYYLYCYVGYRGRAPPAGRGPLGRSVTLRSSLYRAGGAYGPGIPQLLLEGAETVTSVLDPARRHEYGPLWFTSVGFGGLVQLRRGERVYVNISHPDLVDYRRGKTFFGAVMVG